MNHQSVIILFFCVGIYAFAWRVKIYTISVLTLGGLFSTRGGRGYLGNEVLFVAANDVAMMVYMVNDVFFSIAGIGLHVGDGHGGYVYSVGHGMNFRGDSLAIFIVDVSNIFGSFFGNICLNIF